MKHDILDVIPNLEHAMQHTKQFSDMQT